MSTNKSNKDQELLRVIDSAYAKSYPKDQELLRVIDSAYSQWQKSKVKDSARQFKVYFIDADRRTRTLFVKAYDEDDALEVAAERLPEGCEVHSAVDTNPLG